VTARAANALVVGALLGLLLSVSLTAPRWARWFRRPLPAETESAAAAAPEAAGAPRPEPPPLAEAERKIEVKLFFESSDRPGLLPEERTVGFSPDLSRQLRVVVEELIAGPRTSLLSPLPAGTRVLDVFVTARGVAYVDLSREVSEKHTGGSVEERLSVYCVVNTITANFPSITRVQILLEGRPAQTLAGHVDLSRPLPPDMTLLAETAEASPPAPEATPPASPAPPPPPTP
jgi:hypothetical protein